MRKRPTRRWRRTAAPRLRLTPGGNPDAPLTLDRAFPAAVAHLFLRRKKHLRGMQQAFDYIVKARLGTEQATVRLWRSFTSPSINEEDYTQIARFIFELSRGLDVGAFDRDWFIDGVFFVDSERASATPSVESNRLLESTGKERLLALSDRMPDSSLRRWVTQEAHILDL